MKYLILCFGCIAIVTSDYVNDIIFLLSDFFKEKYLKFGVLFICWKRSDLIKLHLKLQEENIRAVYLTQNISPENTINYIKNTQFNSGIGLILDYNCENSQFLLYEIAKLNYFQCIYKWLMFDKYTFNSSVTLKQIFKNVSLRMDSDVTFAIKSNKQNVFTLYDVYNPGFGIGGEVMCTKMGFYSNKKIHIINKVSKYHRRKNMTSIMLHVGTVIAQNVTVPFEEYIIDRSHPNYDSISKLNYVLFKHVQWYHNFRMNIVTVDKWFGKTPTGTDENSLAQLLYEKKIDYSCCAGLITSPRLNAIDYLISTYQFRTCFIFRNPGSSSTVRNEFLKPFTPMVWYTVFCCAIIIMFVLRIIYWAEENVSDISEESAWINSILIILSAFCQQGIGLVPQYFAGRVVILCLLLMSLIMYNYYTSSIVSSLLSDEPTPWKTIDELAHSDMKVGLENIVYVRTLFEVSIDPDVQLLYKTKVFPPGNKEPFYYTVEKGISLVKEGEFAYHTEPSTAYPIIEQKFEPYQICELNEINFFKPSQLVIMTPKKSQYNELFAVTKLVMAGILKREQAIWQAVKPKCLANVKLSQVGIKQVTAILIFLSIGIACALLILCLEILWDKNYSSYIFKQIHIFCRKSKKKKLHRNNK